MAKQYAALPMLSRTHGQTASPTTVGKELANVAARLAHARERIAEVRLDRRDLLLVVAAPEVGAPDAAGEQRVARQKQRRLALDRIAGRLAEDRLLLLEHPPVVTLGRESMPPGDASGRYISPLAGI